MKNLGIFFIIFGALWLLLFATSMGTDIQLVGIQSSVIMIGLGFVMIELEKIKSKN